MTTTTVVPDRQLLELTDHKGRTMFVQVSDAEVLDLADLVWKMGQNITRARLLLGECSQCGVTLEYNGSEPAAVEFVGPAVGMRRRLCASCARKEVKS